MALVKKSKIDAESTKTPAASPPKKAVNESPAAAVRVRAPKHRTVLERVAAATEELSSGLTEAAAATKQLGRSMEQIASGAEEAAGASQEQSAAIKRIVTSLTASREEAEKAGRRSEALVATLAEAAGQIGASVRAIERNAERQLASLPVISELDVRAKDIAEITKTVSRISDQTNLLALNAAIEAARAGDHGRGFAVVADEVRALAETSEKSARQVQSLAGSMNTEVQRVVAALKKASENAANDARAAADVIAALSARRDDMATIAAGSRDIAVGAAEAERAAVDAESGAEQIASAAEQQSAGALQAQSAVQQQAKSLDQAQKAAESLAALAEDFRAGKGGAESSEQISAAAEELSATIQELSSAATEVMASVEQIDRACRIQASATQQTSAALAQIERSARRAEENIGVADRSVQAIDAALKNGRAAVERLVESMRTALEDTQGSIATMKQLGGFGREIEKIVNAIALTTVQTGMLAVSGSVEAARTGESGRGFAIVSNDIRSLAREASANVERANDTVRGVLDQIAAMKADLEQIVATSEVEVQNNRAIFALLERIGSEMAEMSAGNKTIIRGAAEVLAGTVEAATGARQVASAAEEASAASKQAATAAAEQAQGAEDLAAAIEEIASLADELKRDNA
jgi:methyl-accepting chemotaxis protein